MKYSRILPAASLLFLAACTSAGANGVSLQDKLQNPLYAQHYYEDLVNHMVSLEIHNNPILQKSGIKPIIDKARLDAVVSAQAAAKQKDNGPHGIFMSDDEEVQGSVLFIAPHLYIGPDFLLSPSPSAHFYLTSENDPRKGTFPDSTAVDLGEVQDAYGAQTITAPTPKSAYHTLVIYDTQMKKILGFAQLEK